MKAAFLYKIWLKLAGEPESEAGEITLYSDAYGKLTEADAVAALRAEIQVDSSGMVAWRQVYVPREVFRGFRCELVSTWLDEPQIVSA